VAASKKIRILLADDQPIVRGGLAAMINLRSDMTVVAEASQGREAIQLFRRHRPDITLMDLRMPVMEGVDAIALIRQEFPDARIIVLTTFDGDEDIYRGIEAGAKGYLLKDAEWKELVEAIHDVHSGKTCIPPEIGSKLAVRMSTPTLTPRELEILNVIAAGKSNKEIGAQTSTTEGTIKIHVTNILKKLGVNDRTQAATLAIRRGLLRTQ